MAKKLLFLFFTFFTLNIYAHVLESMEQTAPNMWGQILQGKVE